MSGPLFSWLWGDPAESLDRLRAMRERAEAADREKAERMRIKKARRIRQLVKLAKAGKLKGQAR